MTKKYKTSQKNRESYIYYSGSKKIATILPGKNGVTEIDIRFYILKMIRKWTKVAAMITELLVI
ncbi:hypothetical protein [Paracerasibacillus soli]|uniref:Uncharacterized protein n=1 Tax=Paracerasibacillus soli TaxID=480284 RepID=A0ABU5CWD5_9BACI|nr:hypothetical protein [Virgibacillus soli]MDY0410691.1 hypothetical protein [Virgibacillus soli]